MRVLVISAAFPPMRAGEADHAFHLCRSLADRGLDIHVLTTKKNVVTGSFPFRVYPLMRNWSWSDLPRLARFVRRLAPEAVLLMYSDWIYNSHPMITFVPTLSRVLLSRVPVVTQFLIDHTSIDASLLTRTVLKAIAKCAGPRKIDYILGTLLHTSARVIVLSEHHRLRFAENFPGVSSKIVVIPPPPLISICSDNNGAARQRVRERLGVKADDFVIAYFGYVDPTKGVDTLLKAFQIVAGLRRNVRLIMVGGGNGDGNAPLSKRSEAITRYEQAMYELPKQLGIADEVTWTGGYKSDSEEASMYFRAADACVLAFDKGITLNRSSFAAAAAHGLPIITTKGTVVESPFVDQKNVLLCPPKDPKALAVAIDLLIGNPELQQRLGTGALELAHEWFSWDKAVGRTIEAFNSTGS